MENKLIAPKYKILSDESINKINSASFDILENIGVRITNKKVWSNLLEFGAGIDKEKSICKFPVDIIEKAIKLAGKKHILYGRDHNNAANFGYGSFNFNGSGGQTTIIDQKQVKRKDPDLSDLRKAIKIGDSLEHINIVGAMVVPMDIDPKLRDIITFYELLDGTTKPFFGWIFDGRAAKAAIEMMKIVKGSSENLKKYPPYEAFIEPISPLAFTDGGIDILIEFANAGFPVGFGPMVQAGSTGSIFLAGTLAQEHAEVLAGIIISQALKPGLPVTYGGIPHIMDMKAAMISFGSPEQGLMAAAITQLAKSFGFPVYNNTGMSDSKISDFQSGFERGSTIMLGALAGGDIFGHFGISGADNGADLIQLILDNEMIGHVKRMLRSFEVTNKTISLDTIKETGIGGNYITHPDTLENYKKEIYYPELSDRFIWDKWESNGSHTILDKAFEKENKIMKTHKQEFLDDKTKKECQKLIGSYKKELGIA